MDREPIPSDLGEFDPPEESSLRTGHVRPDSAYRNLAYTAPPLPVCRDNAPDIQTIEVTSDDPENQQMEMMAKLAAKRLGDTYPAHLWAIGWAPGMALIIKNMSMQEAAKYGYTIDVPACATISEFEREVVMGGGELLERCGVTRGAWNGEFFQLQDKS